MYILNGRLPKQYLIVENPEYVPAGLLMQVKSLRLSHEYMRHRDALPLVQVMALIGKSSDYVYKNW